MRFGQKPRFCDLVLLLASTWGSAGYLGIELPQNGQKWPKTGFGAF